MAINFYAQDVTLPNIKKNETKEWIKKVAQKYDMKVGDVSYIFCNDEKILEVNNEFLKHDYYTDIITFDYTEGNKIGGDIFISLDTVKSNAEQFQQEYDQEIHRVIIHGILHLCGIDDQSPEQRANMISKENEALELLKEMTQEN
ncbi:MAG: rRNA maturation RNase YbeY [Bacteroidales bacterium]|nr:rRNA maturation RNase YbeY [Bacteroidales bacterium]